MGGFRRFLLALAILTMPMPVAASEFDPAVFFDPPPVAPELTLRGANDRLTRLSELQGSYVLLNFWATWCAPCLEEMPGLNRLQSDLSGQNFRIVAASIEGKRQFNRIDLFYENNRLYNLPVYMLDNPSDKRLYDVEGVPTTVLIDPQGRQLWRIVGPVDWDGETARRLVEQSLQAKK